MLPPHFQFSGPMPKPALRAQPDLPAWYASPEGQALRQALQAQVDRLVPDLFGCCALQAGFVPTQDDWLRESRIQHRFILGTSGDLQGHCSALPVQADSLDLLLLAHSLDESEDPHQVLREAERVLRVEGHLLVIGFNPLSLLGLRAVAPGLKNRLPEILPGLGSHKLQQALMPLGFEVIHKAQAGWAPGSGWRSVTPRLQGLSGRHLPLLGGAYALLAKKRVSTLTPVHGQRTWRLRSPRLGRGVARPICRRGEHD
ncbi:Methyltransferase domain-containing protein [Ectothiorhodosinus mongolicus]|uniref:Methyltransferase domain-containing protein n=1 Tax=Ectothiorhodosinus mongolicus TaxID=233100 RepID=A0A1R3VNX1_9GAMM|nr:methyltransferase domain-containing protein [Ectothiorhodosinus mongolicus]ULX56557.1 methyltransferase type 11 [Ectothiorhodosinus mongolicus]SIT66313.1 Methyltransferase domain-containing protein [Ectothiorhodosinus mongolicus]